MKFSAGIIIQRWLKLIPELQCEADRELAAAALAEALFAAQSSNARYASEVSPELLSELFTVDTAGDAFPCETE